MGTPNTNRSGLTPLVHALTFSKGILKIPYLGSFLGVEVVSGKSPFLSRLSRPGQRESTPGKGRAGHVVVGWGNKKNTAWPREYAASHGLAYLTLEDGFLRSAGLSGPGHPPLSLVIDDMGIYYDATTPSRLENILNGCKDPLADLMPASVSRRHAASDELLENEALLDRAGRCIEKIVSNRLSKYNDCPDITLEPTDTSRVLVVDQTAGDLSIQYGLAGPASFTRMLEAALAEHPGAEILVKIHPDVIAGKKQGHLLAAGKHPRVRILDTAINPISLIQQVDHVYVVSSQTGFEALMTGKPVTCFGAPFYAGWGLTDDRIELPGRRTPRSVKQLFAAACILYARYRDPWTGAGCEIEAVIDYLALQRHWFNENAGDLYCYGFSLWKRGFVRSYLHSPWNRVHFIRSMRQIPVHSPGDDVRIVVWGRQEPAVVRARAKKQGIPLWRIEDGFLRSVGLGSDLVVPASLVVDKQGIYFDPTHPSDLEKILQDHAFTGEQLSQARSLREAIVSAGLSKYNVGQSRPLQHTASPGQRVILVPGQVEDDASIRLGCRDIRTNAQLLRAVREAAPEAYIIYKPHPDVLSCNRGNAKEPENNEYYQQLVTDVSISQCLDEVDEVHTMTSLAGFEGLLRGKRVVTYGIPFYAGWGLTDDRHRSERRTRKLILDELVAGCLLKYPRYMYGSSVFLTPEIILGQFEYWCSASNNNNQIISSRFSRAGRKFMNLLNGIFYAR
jgi:capsular polysaccharide export protein